jgi:flagellar assembly protein FliH
MGLIKSADVPLSVSVFSMQDVEAAAKAVLHRARAKADQITAAAHADGERAREEARKDGFAQGKRQGHAEGLDEGKKSGHAQALSEHSAAMTQLIGSLTAAMSRLDSERDQLQTQAINEVVRLACVIARKVTKRQGLFDTQMMFENLKEAMSLAVHASDVRIAVHPGQVETLRAELPHLRLVWPQLKHIRLIEDPAMAPGGARVFTPHGEIDGDLDVQLDHLIAQLLPGELGESGSGEAV